MKKQAIVTALGVLVALAMTAPSFAATAKAHHAANHVKAPSAYTGYYDFGRARGQLHRLRAELCDRRPFRRHGRPWPLIEAG